MKTKNVPQPDVFERGESEDLLLRFASLGDEANVASILSLKSSRPSTCSCARALRRAAAEGHAECVRLLIPFSDPKPDGSEALGLAAKGGHLECVRILIPASDPLANESHALAAAAENGNIDCVSLLIPVSNPKHSHSRALCEAAWAGHLECVKMLLPVSDAKARNSRALSMAASVGRRECLELLLPASEPSAGGSRALLLAARRGHVESVQVLLQCSPPLIDLKLIFAEILKDGQAAVAALMLAHDSRLLDGVDLHASIAHAASMGSAGLVELLSSVVDRQALSATLDLRSLPRGPARL